MMTEIFFQFIWKYSLYNSAGLTSTNGEPIMVQFAGNWNKNSGPDFEEAKIRIGSTLLVGNVELHLKSSDWQKHKHHKDKVYDNIILHVVLEDDEPLGPSYANIPTLVLQNAIPKYILNNYQMLYFTKHPIPCSPQFNQVKPITKEAWLSRLLAERWEQKFLIWDELLKQNKGDWRVLLYWQLATNFGFKTNSEQFLALAQSLPVNILAKHRDNLFQIEALLFGQAGLLKPDFTEEYPFRLFKEYEYLSKKYGLKPIKGHLWKFMRLRPANFPTIRIAQFAALVHQSLHLFTKIVASASREELMDLFEVSASAYWHNHFKFDELQKQGSEKNLGKESIENIIINTIAPIRYMFSSRSGVGNYFEHSLQLLEEIKPEKNQITKKWADLNWAANNAAQSQAQIQLFNQYCSQKKCLECSIGHSIIKLSP